MNSIPAKITAPLPTATPQLAKSLSQQELSEHRAKIAFEVKVMLSAYFDPKEDETVKSGLLAWFCDELQDWKLEQVVWGIRQWNRENPRRRPSPGDLLGVLKKRRGEEYAKRRAADPEPATLVITEEARARNAARVAELFPTIKRVPEVKE